MPLRTGLDRPLTSSASSALYKQYCKSNSDFLHLGTRRSGTMAGRCTTYPEDARDFVQPNSARILWKILSWSSSNWCSGNLFVRTSCSFIILLRAKNATNKRKAQESFVFLQCFAHLFSSTRHTSNLPLANQAYLSRTWYVENCPVFNHWIWSCSLIRDRAFKKLWKLNPRGFTVMFKIVSEVAWLFLN